MTDRVSTSSNMVPLRLAFIRQGPIRALNSYHPPVAIAIAQFHVCRRWRRRRERVVTAYVKRQKTDVYGQKTENCKRSCPLVVRSSPSFVASHKQLQLLFSKRPHPLPLYRLVLILQHRHHCRIRERGRVAECAALGDVAQEAAHDLARAGLGEIGAEDDVVGLRDCADLARDVVAELLIELGGGLLPLAQRDDGGDRLDLHV